MMSIHLPNAISKPMFGKNIFRFINSLKICIIMRIA